MKEPTRKQTTTRSRNPPPRRMPSMSERQLNAYLLTRDALRRIQRTAALFDGSRMRDGRV